MAYLSDESVQHITRELERAKGALAAQKEEARSNLRQALDIAEVGAGVLGFSYLNARYGNSADKSQFEVMGIPVDVLAAGVLHGMAWMKWCGGYEEDAHKLGTGALGAWLARLGTNLGKGQGAGGGASATTRGQFGAGYASGALPAGGVPQGATRYVVTEVPAHG